MPGSWLRSATVSLLDSLLDPENSEAVGIVAVAFAGIERDLHEAIREHYEALGADPPEDAPPIGERVEELRTLVGRHVEGDLWEYFVEEEAPEALKNAEEARAFAGLDDDEWGTRLEALAENAPEDYDGTPRERADAVVRSRFGLDLETFEERIVRWRPERTLSRGLRGPIDADIARLRAATAAIESPEE